MNRVINLPMLANPFNWLIIYLVLAFGGMAIRAVAASSGHEFDLPKHG